MNAGVRQSYDLTLKQFLGIRLGTEAASFQKQDLLARSQKFPCDRYACRPRADNTDIRREGSPILKCIEIFYQLDRASASGVRAVGSIHWALLPRTRFAIGGQRIRMSCLRKKLPA